MEKEMQYYLADVSELIPYVRNARTHSEAQVSQIAASIREFGFLSPILVAEDNTILAGHGRLAAALKLGLKKVPCVKENHLTETQKRAYIIADNKLSLNAGWDNELLAVELSELEGADFNLDLLGFDEAELSSIFDADKDVSDDDFDVEKELEEPCFSKTGDIWTLGKHRVICGDATKLETYKTLLENTKVNLVVTDPPYNVNYEGSAGKIKNDNMEDDKFYQFLFNSFVNMEQAMADDASIYVFHADTEGLNFRKAFQDAGFYLSGCCIWKKPSLVLGRSPYQWQHEPCLYGWKKKGKHKWYAGRKETSVWEFEKSKKNADHPTMKPIALLAYPIKNSSMTNSLVLDPFAGSGSTLIACEQTGRICYAIELDEKYCDVIVKRYIEQVGNDKSVKVLRGGKEYSFTEVCANE
ncbi:site-specific DNA-methyltransferase [Gardnerella pickettii]|uniref:Methyltransferase n=2 Tax=Gardnerella pickettii TaxID=2914924 RepID=T2PM04_9BIFI|nr:site-specific DNA-methyltransferase [Gardnerella pickettii]EPI51586.1 DNA (cytosine-5-)-methyltransferase [Gardnerella pickettii JCP8017A]EPI59191.1 DNA (cytosine-5-)-methyltransferase [Gardnerella pickettii JCP8017B]